MLLMRLKNQCALARRTSQIMKNGQDVIIEMVYFHKRVSCYEMAWF